MLVASDDGKRDDASESGGGMARGTASHGTGDGSGRILSAK